MKVTREEAIRRTKLFYSYFVGIPSKKVALNTVRDGPGYNAPTDEQLIHKCGSTACVLGWAPAIPEFRALGLRFVSDTYEAVYDDGTDPDDDLDPIGRFFGLTPGQADTMFAPTPASIARKHRYLITAECRLDEKREALRRIRTQLYKWGAISKERSAELAKQEKQLKD